MRVIVTGGSGRGGRFVVEELDARGHEVVNLDRVPPPDGPGRHVRLDLCDAGAVYDAFGQFRPEGVCHLAADPAPGGQARVDVFTNNVRSTYHVLQAAGDLGVERVVYASSEMATGLLTDEAVPDRIPFDETERRPSSNAYALSKYLAEVTAESLDLRYPDTSFVGLRLSNIIPPDRYDMLEPRRRDPGRLGNRNFWSYVDARDVGTAFADALEGDTTGHEVFLVAAADTCLERPLHEAMDDFYDGYDRIDPDRDPSASAFDCSKMLEAFGWRPSHSWRGTGQGPDAPTETG